MKRKPVQLYEARAAIAKALAHPSRQLMLDALAEGEMCVCDLTELVGADQSTVSKHLAVLRNAGIVDTRKEGTMTICRLKICCLPGLWSCIELVLEQDLASRKDAIGSGRKRR
jgi:ArsR family transcriptional regulator, arsenate/arsenite/antimonite-responsive transcriptional repressor